MRSRASFWSCGVRGESLRARARERSGGRSRDIRESRFAAFSSEGSEVDQPRGEGKGSRGLSSWTQDVIWRWNCEYMLEVRAVYILI